MNVMHMGKLQPDPMANVDRLVVWFSAGGASAYAAKLAMTENASRLPVEICYCNPGSEHPDNQRFIQDCERWFGQSVRRLNNPRYEDTWDVFEKERYLVGVLGAKCTQVLKKDVRHRFQRPGDLQVFGFDATEAHRAKRMAKIEPDIFLWCPLIDGGLSKVDCMDAIRAAGIEIPAMYRLGYKNNNCIGCVKGQAGYWNKIRVDFPDVFRHMAEQERELDAAINKRYEGKTRIRIFLDELDPGAGRYEQEPGISCGILCEH